MYVFIELICFSILVICIVHFLVTLSQSEARACTKQIPKYNKNSCLHNASGPSILKTYINTKMK